MHYCPRRLADHWCARPVGPLHHRKPWRTDPGRQDHTLLPSADVPSQTSKARACSPPTPKRNAVTAPGRAADRDGSRGSPALPSRHAPALPRPSHPGLRIV